MKNRKIRPETIDKCLFVLKEMKYYADQHLPMDTKGICEKHHTSQSIARAAKYVGFFTSKEPSVWGCNKDYFDPLDARKVICAVYDLHLSGKIKKNQATNGKNGKEIEFIGEPITKEPDTIPPLIENVRAYCALRKNDVNPEKWFAYYESKNWMIGKNRMKNWKAAIHTWEQQNYNTVFVNKDKPLSEYLDKEIINELKKRGYSGLLELKQEIQF